MNLNMFRVLTPEEETALQQYADQKAWCSACVALGATMVELTNYEASAQAFARTTLYPNSRIVAEARKAAQEALLRGEPMPQDAEQALQSKWSRELARLLGL